MDDVQYFWVAMSIPLIVFHNSAVEINSFRSNAERKAMSYVLHVSLKPLENHRLHCTASE